MGKIFDMGKNLHLKKSEKIMVLPYEGFEEDVEKFKKGQDLAWVAKHIGAEMDKLTGLLFGSFTGGTQTATSINSRIETIVEGETRKAEVKLIEYKPKTFGG